MESGWTEVSKASRRSSRNPERTAPKKTSQKTGQKKGSKKSQKKEPQESQVPKVAPVQVTELLRPRKQRETTVQPAAKQLARPSFSYAEAAKGKSPLLASTLQPGHVVASPSKTTNASATSSAEVTSTAGNNTTTASTHNTRKPKARACARLQEIFADPVSTNGALVTAKESINNVARHTTSHRPPVFRPKITPSKATPNPRVPPFHLPRAWTSVVAHPVHQPYNPAAKQPTTGRVYSKRRRCFSTGHISAPTAQLPILPLPIWYFVALSRTRTQPSQQTIVPLQLSRPSHPYQPSRQPTAHRPPWSSNLRPENMRVYVDKMNREMGSLDAPEAPILTPPQAMSQAGREYVVIVRPVFGRGLIC